MNKEEAIKELLGVLLSLESAAVALQAVKETYIPEDELMEAYLSGLSKEVEIRVEGAWFYTNQARNELKQNLRNVSKGERELKPGHPGDAAIIKYAHAKITSVLLEGRRKAEESKK